MYLPLKRSETIRPPLLAIRSGHTIRTVESPSVLSGILITTTTTTLEPDPFDKSIQPEEPTLSRKESKKKKEKEEVAPGIRQMARQRARIHRQLRLIFIYPLVYTLMWVLPFVQHCMMYQDYFACHPIWALRLGGTICIASMGFVDCLIFSLREKPWKAIATSDGTLLGSFLIWRGSSNVRRINNLAGGSVSAQGNSFVGPSGNGKDMAETAGGGGLMGNVRSVTRSASGSVNDWSRAGIEQARLRLEMERDERMRLGALTERTAKRQHAGFWGYEESGSVYSGDGNGSQTVGEGVIVEGLDEGGEEKMDGMGRVDKGKERAVDV